MNRQWMKAGAALLTLAALGVTAGCGGAPAKSSPEKAAASGAAERTLKVACIATYPPFVYKDKEDKIYASGHSMASAILGFVASVIVTSPLDGAVKKIFGSNGYLKDKDGNIIKDKDGKPRIFSKKLFELAEKEKALF